MMAAMALGALVLGVPHFEGSTTPSLAPKTSEAPAQQPQPPQQQADEGHHPLKQMQKRVLAHEQKIQLEKAQGKMRKLEKAREKNAGKQGGGHEKKELKKKVMAKKRLKNARARRHGAARVHNAEQEEVRQYNHARGAGEPPAPPRKMIMLSRGRAGSSVVAQTIAKFALANADTVAPQGEKWLWHFEKEIFGGNAQAMEWQHDPVKVMTQHYQMLGAEQPAAPLLGFKWKPEPPTYNAAYGKAWDWVKANNVSVVWMTRNLLDVRISCAKHNNYPTLGSSCTANDAKCIAQNQGVKVTLEQISVRNSPEYKNANATTLPELLAVDKQLFETDLDALLKEKGISYRQVRFEDLFDSSDRADKRGFYIKLRHDSIEAHKQWNSIFNFVGLPPVESYAEVVEAADAQMVPTTAPTQCDALVDPDAVREALKGSEFEKLLEC
jgi:hypothetical protein